MAQFTYLGDHPETECFGVRFRAGVPSEVTDEHAIRKLSNNSHFALVVGGVEVLSTQDAAPKRRGRPPKAR